MIRATPSKGAFRPSSEGSHAPIMRAGSKAKAFPAGCLFRSPGDRWEPDPRAWNWPSARAEEIRLMKLSAHQVPYRAQAIAVLLLAALLLAPSPVIAAPAQAPGSRVVLELPDGFAASPDFSGFVGVANGASILLLEVPASAYPDMASGLSPEALSKKGVGQVQTGSLDRQGEYVYVTGEQQTASGPYVKYILLFREPSATALVSISVPRSSFADGSAEPRTFEQILASARIDPKAGEKPFELSY